MAALHIPHAQGSTTKRLTAAAGTEVMTPADIMKLRKDVLRRVKETMPAVAGVLAGTTTWSNQQVRLFGMLLNKVMPDLHHSFVEGEIDLGTKKATQLTRAQLEEIAARAVIIEAIDVEFEDADAAAAAFAALAPTTEDDRPST